jgi:hypothetical protein
MSYKLLNVLFGSDVAGIIMEYNMISKDTVMKQKNYCLFYLHGKMYLAALVPNNNVIKKFFEFERVNKMTYVKMKKIEGFKDNIVRSWI